METVQTRQQPTVRDASSAPPAPGHSATLEDRLHQLEAENDALKAHLKQANLVLDSATEYAIITLDRTGCITRWNAGAGRIMGYIAAEVLGRCGDIIFTSEDRAAGRFNTELRRALEYGSAVNERWHIRRDGTRFWASGMMMPLLDMQGRPEGFLNILTDRTDARAEVERRELLMGEMNHRIKNNFATIQAVAAQTRRHAVTVEEFQAAFSARLQVLSRSNDILVRGDWVDAPLREVVESALDPYGGTPERVAIEGPPATLAAPLVVVTSLVFHELATNAAKHGALSMPEGSVAVTWTVPAPRAGAPRVEITWRESGGPPVEPPRRRGFGSQLLEQGLPAGSSVKLEYRPHGLECRIVLPLAAEAQR